MISKTEGAPQESEFILPGLSFIIHHSSFINPVAESLSGWKAEEAVGQPVTEVFRLVNEETG
jgi:PAS domain-containing protein